MRSVQKALLPAFLCAIVVASTVHAAAPNTTPHRTVAITLDDLPFAGPAPADKRTVVANMTKLIEQIRRAGAPVTGFVVGRRKGDYDALALWRDAGLPMANHTFSHPHFSKWDIEKYLANLRKNEDVIRRGLGVELRGGFFRYPYLDHGHTKAKNDAMERYLRKGKYTIAPVSLDTVDYAFNAYYVKTMQPAAKQQIAAAYVQHVVEAAAHFEALSKQLYGREIPLVFLGHANPLNADHLGKVLAALKGRGYRFVTLKKALADKAYTHYGLRPPHIPFEGDRNFLNQVAMSRNLKVVDPSGDRHFRKFWKPKLKALVRLRPGANAP